MSANLIWLISRQPCPGEPAFPQTRSRRTKAGWNLIGMASHHGGTKRSYPAVVTHVKGVFVQKLPWHLGKKPFERRGVEGCIPVVVTGQE